MKSILIKSGVYPLDATLSMPSKDICIVGESDALLVPKLGILPIHGVGHEDIRCLKCDYVLAKKVVRNNILVPIKCPKCDTVNRF